MAVTGTFYYAWQLFNAASVRTDVGIQGLNSLGTFNQSKLKSVCVCVCAHVYKLDKCVQARQQGMHTYIKKARHREMINMQGASPVPGRGNCVCGSKIHLNADGG